MGMQYTLRNIPFGVDRALRQRAKEQHKSLNQVAIEALQRALGLKNEPIQHRDLSDIAGTWVDDPNFDDALKEQDRIDPELWR
jgi:plasmid stability protein